MREENTTMVDSPDITKLNSYINLMHIYDSAIKIIITKLEILNDEFNAKYNYNPIHNIENRLKSINSIAAKLKRFELSLTVDNIKNNLKDVAGVRVICNYISDVYRIRDLLFQQRDISIIEEKDYIKEPKSNGYRSLHLVLTIPVFLSKKTEIVPIEVQIRTIAMDFWASLEHELKYKKETSVTPDLRLRLKMCADLSNRLDKEMESIQKKLKEE